MPITIGSNIASLRGQRMLAKGSSELATSFERLASGMRINRASDDAAGLSIASSLQTNSRIFSTAIRNVSDGLSAAAIAEGALTALQSIAERQLELVSQAANGAYSLKQRQSMNTEANALVNEFNRITNSTVFNGMSLLDPALPGVVIQAGSGAQNGIALDLTSLLKRAVGDGTFTASQSLTVSGYPFTQAQGDFNGDGNADLLLSTQAATHLLLLGNADGSFADGIDVPTAGLSVGVDVGDFNNDGILDFVGANNSAAGVYLGRGDGTFIMKPTKTTGGFTFSVAAGDYNNDGKLDVVTANFNNELTILFGDGTGSFTSVSTMVTGGSTTFVKQADINGDGRADFIALDGSTSLSVFINNGSGTFSKTLVNTGAAATFATFADFDGDGRMDIAASTGGAQYGRVLLGNGDGSFRAAATLAVGSYSYGINSGDFNGDGRSDVAINGSGFTRIFLSNGDGSFARGLTVSTGTDSYFVAVADFNKDGRDDFVVSPASSTLQTFLGNGGFSTSEKYMNLNSLSNAREAISTITATLNRITAQLGAIGSVTSRLAVATNHLEALRSGSEEAAGRIMDADIAAESASVLRNQILQQAAQAVLAQANQSPALALALLR